MSETWVIFLTIDLSELHLIYLSYDSCNIQVVLYIKLLIYKTTLILRTEYFFQSKQSKEIR